MGKSARVHSVGELGSWLYANLSTVKDDVSESRKMVEEYGQPPPYGVFVDTYHLPQLNQSISDAVLQQKCQTVMENINKTVFSEWHGNESANSHGLAIYFPRRNILYEAWDTYYPAPHQYPYDQLDMSVTYMWDEFLKEYLGIEE